MNGHMINNQQFHPFMGYPMLRPPIDMGNGIMPSYSHMSHQHWTSNTESMTNQTGHETDDSVELQVEQQSPSQPPIQAMPVASAASVVQPTEPLRNSDMHKDSPKNMFPKVAEKLAAINKTSLMTMPRASRRSIINSVRAVLVTGAGLEVMRKKTMSLAGLEDAILAGFNTRIKVFRDLFPNADVLPYLSYTDIKRTKKINGPYLWRQWKLHKSAIANVLMPIYNQFTPGGGPPSGILCEPDASVHMYVAVLV
jgi:hypothetical protein